MLVKDAGYRKQLATIASSPSTRHSTLLHPTHMLNIVTGGFMTWFFATRDKAAVGERENLNQITTR